MSLLATDHTVVVKSPLETNVVVYDSLVLPNTDRWACPPPNICTGLQE